jgi:hypothetical protein
LLHGNIKIDLFLKPQQQGLVEGYTSLETRIYAFAKLFEKHQASRASFTKELKQLHEEQDAQPVRKCGGDNGCCYRCIHWACFYRCGDCEAEAPYKHDDSHVFAALTSELLY